MSSTKLDYNSLNPNLQKVKFQLFKIPILKIPIPNFLIPHLKTLRLKRYEIGELGARAGNPTRNPTRQLGNKEAGKLGADALKFRKLHPKFDFY